MDLHELIDIEATIPINVFSRSKSSKRRYYKLLFCRRFRFKNSRYHFFSTCDLDAEFKLKMEKLTGSSK